MKKAKPKRSTESIRVKKAVIDLVKKEKEVSGIAVGRFFEIAAIEKLNKKA